MDNGLRGLASPSTCSFISHHVSAHNRHSSSSTTFAIPKSSVLLRGYILSPWLPPVPGTVSCNVCDTTSLLSLKFHLRKHLFQEVFVTLNWSNRISNPCSTYFYFLLFPPLLSSSCVVPLVEMSIVSCMELGAVVFSFLCKAPCGLMVLYNYNNNRILRRKFTILAYHLLHKN